MMKYTQVILISGLAIPKVLKEKVLPKKYVKSGPRIFGTTTPGRMAMKQLRKGLRQEVDKDKRIEHHTKLYMAYLKECADYLTNVLEKNKDIVSGNIPTAQFDAGSKTLKFKPCCGPKNVKALHEMVQSEDTVFVKLNKDINFVNEGDSADNEVGPAPIAFYNKKTKVLSIQYTHCKDTPKHTCQPGEGAHPDPVYIKLDEQAEKAVLGSQGSHNEALAMDGVLQYVANTNNRNDMMQYAKFIPKEYKQINDDATIYRGMDLKQENHDKFNNGEPVTIENRPFSSWSYDKEESRGFITSTGGLLTTIKGSFVNDGDGVLVNLTHPDFAGVRWQSEIVINGSGPLTLNDDITEFVPQVPKK